jgi:hypothetical protein
MLQNWLDVFAHVQSIPGVQDLEHSAKNALVGWIQQQIGSNLGLTSTASAVEALVSEGLLKLGIS